MRNQCEIVPAQLGTVHSVNVAVDQSGLNVLVAPVTGKRLRLLGLALYAAADVACSLTATDAEDAATTALLGNDDVKLSLLAGMGFVLPIDVSVGWGDTAAGEGLALDLASAVGVAGRLVYQVLS